MWLNVSSSSRSDTELDDRPKKDKLYLKKKGIGSDARAERMEKADSDVQLLNESERARFLQKQKKRRIKGREEDASQILPFLQYLLSSNL